MRFSLQWLRDHLPPSPTPTLLHNDWRLDNMMLDANDPGYSTFAAAQASRPARVYVGANDGMLHALNGDTGVEMWAYVPRITMPKIHRLATENWTVTHEFNVDGSPEIMDAYFGGAGSPGP